MLLDIFQQSPECHLKFSFGIPSYILNYMLINFSLSGANLRKHFDGGGDILIGFYARHLCMHLIPFHSVLSFY